MRISLTSICSLLLASTAAAAKSAWSFEDGRVSVRGKGVVEDSGVFKEKLTPDSALKKTVTLGPKDTLKVLLTATEGKKGKKPAQAFLTLHEASSGLEESFPFALKDSGKASIEVTHKDIPYQFLTSTVPVQAYLTLASFGSTTPYRSVAFDLTLARDANVPVDIPSPPVRYGRREEIHHVFRSDPTSPPVVITAVFTIAVAAALPALLAGWLLLGANVNHLGEALSAAPVAHALFFGSVVAMEGVFFLYYTSWKLFQVLPVAAVIGVVALFSGSKALTEVQERRLAGKR